MRSGVGKIGAPAESTAPAAGDKQPIPGMLDDVCYTLTELHERLRNIADRLHGSEPAQPSAAEAVGAGSVANRRLVAEYDQRSRDLMDMVKCCSYQAARISDGLDRF